MSNLVLEVGNCVTSITQGRLTSEQYQEFKKALGWRPEDYQYAVRAYTERVKVDCIRKGYSKDQIEAAVAQAKKWGGYKSNVRYNRGSCGYKQSRPHVHFDSGLLSKAREFLDKYNITYSLKDVRPPAYPKTHDYELSEAFELRDYQLKIKEDAVKQQRGIIKLATGGGKTSVAASIIAELGVSPFIFYVTSKDLLRQAYDEFTKFIRYNNIPLEVGRVGAGYKEIKDVTVMTVQTAVRCLGQKYKSYDDEDNSRDKTDYEDIKKDVADLVKGAKGFIADEVQHYASESCQIISDYSESARWRFGMSATPWRDMGDDILIDACFGKCIADISASFLIERGYLVRPEIFFLNVKNMANCPYTSYSNIYEHALKQNDLRNEWIAKISTKFLNMGRLPLILVKHIDHGETLNNLIPNSSFIHGSLSNKKRNAHLDAMRAKETGVTIATSIFDEGVDVKPLDTIILAGSGKSQTRALQRIGRILRPYPNIQNNQKKSVVAIDFMDDVKYLREHSEKRLKIYRHEPLFDIKFLDL